MTAIKICGIQTAEQALAAARAGVDFIGLMFASSRRQITPETAAGITTALCKAKAAVGTVGVFVNVPAGTVKEIAEICRLDWVQLSGDEPWEYCLELDQPVIKVIRVDRSNPPEQVVKSLEYGTKLLGKQKHIFMLDASVPEKYGGTGERFDWELARPAAKAFPIMIAGGLTPDNVPDLVKEVAPWGVDVSSGVETGGIKDMTKIKKFIEAVRQTDAVAR
jgi:phosphoribosylanthranilate isomerase